MLSTGLDFEILAKCKRLEKMRLAKEDTYLVSLIKTQLECDWRRPLLKALDKLIGKYGR
ncbi:MAG: hypothetical protein HY367_01025 [Candidatus Aenigmarchaeota archaeon]|nr:hypothetical protein [Candidatus Aenigmarchaeota archaeon]